MTGLVVRPVRFTDDVMALRSFFERLGMAPRLESTHGGWIDLVGSGGMIGLHSTAASSTGGRAGETRLSFETDDADALAERLHEAGFADAWVFDEAYGRVVEVTDPLGGRVLIDERQDDLHGYLAHVGRPTPDAPVVVPTRFTDRPEKYDAFLVALGLVGAPEPGGFAAYSCAGHGRVGVHPVLPGEPLTQLGLWLADEAALVRAEERLADLGPRRVGGGLLVVTDPDGVDVQLRSGS